MPFSAKIESRTRRSCRRRTARSSSQSLGLESAGLDRLIRAGYDLLGLQTYFTAGEQEVRAWTIHKGDTAPVAAGVIHTDFERGFIRAETVAYPDFIAMGGWKGAQGEGGGAVGGEGIRGGGWGCAALPLQRLTAGALYSTLRGPVGLGRRVFMSRRTLGSFRAAGFLLLIGAGSPHDGHRRGMSEGWTFTWRTVTTVDAPGRHTTDTAYLPVQMVGGRFRVGTQGVSADPTGMMKGSYMIFDSDSGTMTFVIPAQKMAMQVDLSSFAALSGMIKREITAASSLRQDLGPGDQILGHPTRHVRTVRAYTLHVASPFDSSTTTNESESDEWRATDLALGDPFALIESRFSTGAVSPLGGGASGGFLESRDTIPKGFTLRETLKSRTTASNGIVTTTVTSMEVHDLQRANIVDDSLAVPPGYRTMNPMKSRKPFTKEQRETFMRNCQKNGSKEECEQRLKWMDPGAAADTGKAAS